MQVSVETTEGLGRRMTVQVPSERVEQEVQKRLRDLGGRMRIDGFRPGKVPMKLVRQRYGQQVRSEVLNEVVQATYSEAVDQESLRPAAAPQIEPVRTEEGEELEYVATFEVLPEVELGDIESIEVERPAVEVTDEDVEQVIERVRRQQTEYQPVERAAADGDQVTIDFVGLVDGEPFNGNQAEDVQVVLGAGQLPEAFDEGLVGATAGEQREVRHTFPEGVQDEQIAGREAVFTVTVKQVAEPVLPELNDQFAEQLGIEEGGVAQLREAVRENLQNERDQGVRQYVKRELLQKFADAHEVELPRGLVDGEIQALMQQQGGSTPEDSDPSAYEEYARQRVKLGLLVNEVVRRENIRMDQQRLLDQLKQMTSGSDNPREALEQYAQDRQLMQSLEASVIEDQVVDHLLERVTIKDKPMSFEELVNPQTDPQSE